MRMTLIALATATAGLLHAQTTQEPALTRSRSMAWEHKVSVAGAPQEATIGFLAVEDAAGFAGSQVKGAPYSATVEHTFTQTLADGTRIERKSSSRTARDSEGRTRTEYSPAATGAVPLDLPTTVFIFDPVARQTIVLNEKDKTARVMKMPNIGALRNRLDGAMGAAGMRAPRPAPTSAASATATSGSITAVSGPIEDVVVDRRIEVVATSPGAQEPVLLTHAIPAQPVAGVNHQVMIDDGNSKSESLGVQSVSGVPCNARRNTHTIPAGQIGNDRAIEVVNESCFSDDLKTLLSSRTNDPMHGENVMRLTSISRAEPDKSLFEIPAGYTVKEGPQPMIHKIEKIEKK